MKRINIVPVRGEAAVDQLERFHIRRRTDRATAFAAREELLFRNLLRFRMVRNEYDFDSLILASQKAGHPEDEAPRFIISRSCPWSRTYPST